MKTKIVTGIIFIFLVLIIFVLVFRICLPAVPPAVHDIPDTFPIQSPVPSAISSGTDDSASHTVFGTWVYYVRGVNVYSTREEILAFFPNGSYHYEYYQGPMCSRSSDGNWSAVDAHTIIMDRSSEIRYDPVTDNLISGDKGYKTWNRGDYPNLTRCPSGTPGEPARW